MHFKKLKIAYLNSKAEHARGRFFFNVDATTISIVSDVGRNDVVAFNGFEHFLKKESL